MGKHVFNLWDSVKFFPLSVEDEEYSLLTAKA